MMKEMCIRDRYTAAIENSQQKLHFLVESFIKMSRLEQHIIQIKKEEKDIMKTLRNSLGDVYKRQIREGVRILLESENYSVTEAENGRQGLEHLDENTDLVILDVMMPGLSGLRTCEEIRKVSNVPVLFLTAKAQESDTVSYTHLDVYKRQQEELIFGKRCHE